MAWAFKVFIWISVSDIFFVPRFIKKYIPPVIALFVIVVDCLTQTWEYFSKCSVFPGGLFRADKATPIKHEAIGVLVQTVVNQSDAIYFLPHAKYRQ
jgi:hypothetical protein